jgi:hypothetical protein
MSLKLFISLNWVNLTLLLFGSLSFVCFFCRLLFHDNFILFELYFDFISLLLLLIR